MFAEWAVTEANRFILTFLWELFTTIILIKQNEVGTQRAEEPCPKFYHELVSNIEP